MFADVAGQTINDIVGHYPATIRILVRFGIDLQRECELTMEEACRRHGLNRTRVCFELSLADQFTMACEDLPWNRQPLPELIDHIVSVHHSYLERELPRLARRARTLCQEWRFACPELTDVPVVLEALTVEVQQHMQREEQLIFPWIRRLSQEEALPPGPHFAALLERQKAEHGFISEALARLRWTTDDYAIAVDTPPGIADLVTDLSALEADVHLHLHEENDILFPRAAALLESGPPLYRALSEPLSL